jgi:hypothetical protein
VWKLLGNGEDGLEKGSELMIETIKVEASGILICEEAKLRYKRD